MRASIHARRMARNHSRMGQSSKLNLVSLMDIFTILVFFLMVNSGDVEVLQSDKDIQLPTSVSEQKPDLTLLVKISPTDIIVQGRSVAKVDQVLAEESHAIDALEKELVYLAERRPILTEEQKQKGRSITIMGDQNVPYELLKRVMTTCAQTDYRDISLAVNASPSINEEAFLRDNAASTELSMRGG